MHTLPVDRLLSTSMEPWARAPSAGPKAARAAVARTKTARALERATAAWVLSRSGALRREGATLLTQVSLQRLQLHASARRIG
ncbi:MAG: hypothetical protein ACLQM8_05565 [Limisphaerales bacterium]